MVNGELTSLRGGGNSSVSQINGNRRTKGSKKLEQTIDSVQIIEHIKRLNYNSETLHRLLVNQNATKVAKQKPAQGVKAKEKMSSKSAHRASGDNSFKRDASRDSFNRLAKLHSLPIQILKQYPVHVPARQNADLEVGLWSGECLTT